MTDDGKPKGPILPNTTPAKEGEEKPIVRKPGDNLIDIKEHIKDGKKGKRQQQDTPRERSKKKAKRIIRQADSVEQVTPVSPEDELRKEQRKKHNDKKNKELLRKKQESRFAKFVTRILPARNSAAGNQQASLPSHPLLKKLTGVFDRFNNPNVSQNEHGQQLLLQHQLQNQLKQQNAHTVSTPKPKPG